MTKLFSGLIAGSMIIAVGQAHASLASEYQQSTTALQRKAESDAARVMQAAAAHVGFKIVQTERKERFACIQTYDDGSVSVTQNSFYNCQDSYKEWAAESYLKMSDGRVCLAVYGVEKRSSTILSKVMGHATCQKAGRPANGFEFAQYYGDNSNQLLAPHSNFARIVRP